MRILGIYIRKETAPMVRKNLEPNKWYPFVQVFPKPIVDRRTYKVRKRRFEPNLAVYQVYKDLPRQINICSICGMNGAGKSTLLDIMYRILNNFSFELMKHQKEMPFGLSIANGVYADLYFETEDQKGEIAPGCISCRGDKTRYFFDFRGNEWEEVPLNATKLDTVEEILSTFFYTIVTNYSVYSLNKKDYEPSPLSDKNIEGIDGEWLQGLFHKNDGYFSPIAISPFRKDGVFDIAREKKLAYQRLTALTLYFHSKGRRFIDGYEAYTLRYKYNPNYKENAISKLYEEFGDDGFEMDDVDAMLSAFQTCWDNRYHQLLQYIGTKREHGETILYYLSAKSLRICRIYPAFRYIFNPYNYRGKVETADMYESINNVIDKMLSVEERTHITQKLRRCVNFIEGNIYRISENVSEVMCDTLCEKRFNSYDEASIMLPPPFFDMELVLKKTRRSGKSAYHISEEPEITFSRMSSGELQFLFCISHILYHLKNIQSVTSDKYRVKYHHINLVFDEAELYFHPDYQRRFIKMLLDSLNKADVDRRSIFSVNIIIATHSPFILSDIQVGNILYLENGKPTKRKIQTFGANLYDLMRDSFFFHSSAMGEIALETIGDFVQKVNNGQQTDNRIEKIIGDSAIMSYVKYRRSKNVQDSNSET